MERLKSENLNTAGEYDRIFFEREGKEPDWQDLRRWKMLLKYHDGGDIVDLGCLDSMIHEMLSWGTSYLGIDISGKAVKQMQTKYGNAFTSFSVGNLYETGIDNCEKDYVILGEVLEHLEDPEKAVIEAFRILKPGGVLAISVPLEEAKEPGAVDKDRHLWSFSESDIRNMVKLHSKKIKTKVLRSQWFPYRYCWPTIVVWAWKK